MMWPFPEDGTFPAGRGPRTRDPDVRLTYRVAEALLGDDRTRGRRVTVEVQNGVVLLTGAVPDRSVKRLVREIAAAVPGVADTCDAVRVTGAGQDGSPLEEDFRGVVADLRVVTPPRRPELVVWAVLAALTWAFLTVLMVTGQWIAVVVTGVAAAAAATVAARRRSRVMRG